MRILDIRQLTVPLIGDLSNAVVSFGDHSVSMVAVISDQVRNGAPIAGIGFNSIGRFAQSGILDERVIPRVRGASEADINNVDGTEFDAAAIAATAMLNEKPGGHGDRAGAVAAVELAIWDLNAKLADEPAYATIARHFGRTDVSARTSVYAAGGYYYSSGSGSNLRDELLTYQARGFEAFKIKVGGASLGEDLRRIEVALDVATDSSSLAVDANGRFNLADAIQFGQAIDEYNLRWFEEPGDPLDYRLQSELAKTYDGPLATGENLFSTVDAMNLGRFGGMRGGKDIFQMDPGLSYGLSEYGRTLSELEDWGFDRAQFFPHGGHLINLHIAVGLGLGGCEAYPGIFQPFGGFSPACIVENGYASPTDAPGFGLEQQLDLGPYIDQLLGQSAA